MLPEVSPRTLGDILGALDAQVDQFARLCGEDPLRWPQLQDAGRAVCDLSREVHLRVQALRCEEGLGRGCEKMGEFTALVDELSGRVGDSGSAWPITAIQRFSENVKTRCRSLAGIQDKTEGAAE